MHLGIDHEIIMPGMDMIRSGEVVEVAAKATRRPFPATAGGP